jgi:hypothetical protein
MEMNHIAKVLNVIYQPHPITPGLDRQGMVVAAREGTTVREILLAAGVDPHQPIVINLDGRLLTVEEWDIICPTEGQLLSVQATVQGGGGGSNPLQVVLMIAVVVAAAYIAGPAGVAFFTGMGASATAAGVAAVVAGAVVAIAGSLLIGALFPPQALKSQQLPEVSPTYSLSGGSNRARPYESMPVVMGTHRLFLDYAARPFTEYRGDDQYLYQIFHLGLGNVSATDYRIGTTSLSSYSDAQLISPATDGKFTNFPGNVDTAAGATVTQAAGDIVRTTSADTYQIGIDLESNLFFANDKGGLDARTVEISLQYKPASSGTWLTPATVQIFGNNFSYSSGVISTTSASQKPNRATIYISGLTPGVYDVKLNRSTADSTDARQVMATNWSALRSYQLDDGDYKGQNRVALIIRANDQLNGVVQQFSATLTSQATYWNGSAWVTGVTSNPAHWFMHFARGVYNADGKLMYGVGLPDSQMDLAALHTWAQFCATEGLSFNAVLDGSQTAADIINTIATTGFGSPTWANGKLGAVFDARDASPVAAFGMSNIIRDSFEVAYLSENLAEEIVVRFRNPNKDWEQDEVRTLAPDVVTPLRTSAIELFGCTNPTMAGKFSNYIAAQQYYRRRRVSWQSDFEGFVCQRGDVVLLSHDLTQWGYSGRFVEVNGNVVTLDRAVPRQNQTEYLMMIRPDGTTTTYDVAASTAQESDTLTIVDDLFTLQAGADLIDHRWTFSPLATPGKKLKILSIQPASDARLQIVATDEVPEFYNAWGGTFVPPTTETVLPQQPVSVVNLTLTNRVAFVSGFLTNRVSISWGVGGGTLYSRVKVYLDGNLIREIPQAVVPYTELDINNSGSLFVEVTPYGLTGAGITQTSTLTLAALDLPPPPDTVTLEVGENGRSATFTWTPVLGVQSYVIEVFSGGSVRRAVNVGNTLSYVYTVSDAIADGGPFRSYDLRVYSVNQTGQSTTFASVNFNNPQIGQLQNASVEPMPNSIWFKCDRPTEEDFAAIRVYVSKTLGFTPSAGNIAFDGDSNWITISADNEGNPLESGVVYYVRAAGYDTFGDDNLTLTAELSATILSPAWGLLQDDIETSMLESGLRDRIDLIDTFGDADFPDGLIEGLRSTNTSVNILDQDVDDLGTKLLESALKVQENTDLLYDAGVTVDSTTGEVYIFGVRENANELNEVGIRLDAAEANINLRATTIYVDDAIATAVIDPSQIAELGDIQARLGSAEVDIDGLQAAVTLKADLTTVNSQGARITSAEADINALQGEVALKASNVDLSVTDARVTNVETTLSVLDVPTITQSVSDVKFIQRAQDQIAVTQLQDILTGQANYDGLDVGIAKASTDLRAYTDGQLIAEASARLQLSADLGNTNAALQQESIARATADGALASQITTLQSTVGDNTTAIQVTANTVDGVQGKYTVKIDNNGYVSGYGLISTANNAVPFADFQVIADRFAIAPVAGGLGNTASPFFVLTAPQTINGVTVSAGTYIKQAFIYDAVITTAKINDLAVTNAKIANAAINTAKIATASINNALIQDATIDGNAKIANASIGNAKIADLDAAKINTGFLNAARIQVGSIDARIASINNAQIANLDAGKINTGTLSADRIAVGSIDAKIANIVSAQIQNLAVTNAKIANGAVSQAKIEDATISTAKIGIAQIDTLRVAGNAITVQGSLAAGSPASGSFTINSTTGGSLLVIGFTSAASGGGLNTLNVSVNSSLVFSITGVAVDPTGFPQTAAATRMALVSIGAGVSTISCAGGGDTGFVVTGLLTQR